MPVRRSRVCKERPGVSTDGIAGAPSAQAKARFERALCTAKRPPTAAASAALSAVPSSWDAPGPSASREPLTEWRHLSRHALAAIGVFSAFVNLLMLTLPIYLFQFGRLNVEGLLYLPPGSKEPVLMNGVSFELQPGESLAIVGPSGSGKSSSQLPNDYETVLERSGAPLSGGQKQRIALARAFFGEPAL